MTQPAPQDTAAANQPKPQPTYADIAYGSDARHRLDLYLARSDAPTPLVIFIHGGGFRKNSKEIVWPELLEEMLPRGISVAAINYRYATTAPLPAPMYDGARALQFLRASADRYNLDKTRVGLTGSSAGAGISLWLAMHEDLATPRSSDPVERESTRVTCVCVRAAQVSYDPRFMISLGIEPALENEAFPTILGFPKGTSYDHPQLVKNAEASAPINFISADVPPLRLDYAVPNAFTDDLTVGQYVHHPAHGLALAERCKPLGVGCEVYYPPDHLAPDPPHAFFIRHLKRADA